MSQGPPRAIVDIPTARGSSVRVGHLDVPYKAGVARRLHGLVTRLAAGAILSQKCRTGDTRQVVPLLVALETDLQLLQTDLAGVQGTIYQLLARLIVIQDRVVARKRGRSMRGKAVR
jgi:hypothetical protein